MTVEQLEAMNDEGASAIHIATMNGHTTLLKYFIQERGVNINLQGRGNKITTMITPLMVAASNSSFDIVSFLLDQPDCEPNIMDSNNQVALHFAVGRVHSSDAEKILNLLLSHPKTKGLINHVQAFHTPFQKACYYGRLWAVKILMGQEGIQWGNEKDGEI